MTPNHTYMNAILLRIDDEACKEYESLPQKTKLQLAYEFSLIIKKIAVDTKSAKLEKLIQEVNNHQGCIGINSEMLLRLLPID